MEWEGGRKKARGEEEWDGGGVNISTSRVDTVRSTVWVYRLHFSHFLMIISFAFAADSSVPTPLSSVQNLQLTVQFVSVERIPYLLSIP